MKWLSWLAKMTVAAIFLTVVSLYATWTVVQTYLDKVLAHYQIGVDTKSIGFSDFVANMGKDLNIMNQSVSKEQQQSRVGHDLAVNTPAANTGTGGTTAGKAGTDADTKSGIGGGASGTAGVSGGLTGREEKDGTTSGSDREEEGMADALPVWSQSGVSSQGQSQHSGGEADKKTIVSSESVTSTKDKMSNDDKMKVFSLLVSKLPPTEVQNISRLMEDGITQEELNEINTIVLKYMTQEEYNQMVGILEKYQ